MFIAIFLRLMLRTSPYSISAFAWRGDPLEAQEITLLQSLTGFERVVYIEEVESFSSLKEAALGFEMFYILTILIILVLGLVGSFFALVVSTPIQGRLRSLITYAPLVVALFVWFASQFVLTELRVLYDVTKLVFF